jgi:hypothetical protein
MSEAESRQPYRYRRRWYYRPDWTAQQVAERITDLEIEVARNWHWTLAEYWADVEELEFLRHWRGPRRFCRTDPRSRR